jgi:HK97 family phage major capsid protein
MATALSEYAKLSNDVLYQGIIETIIKDSPILQMMPFIEIVGNALTYNREKTTPQAAFYAVGDQISAPGTFEFEQLTATLKILIEDADVDNYVKGTRQNVMDIEAAMLELAAKAVRQKFEETFIYGTTTDFLGMSGNTKSFDGIVKLINTSTSGTQVVTMGGTGAALTLSKLDELIDAVKPGKPDLLLMSKRSRRKLQALARASGSLLETEKNSFGEYLQLYNGVPIGVSDYIKDTHALANGYETAVTGGNCSTIYALKFGEGAICGIQGPGGLQIEQIGSLESYDAARTRIKWYCAIADFSTLARAALIGVQD